MERNKSCPNFSSPEGKQLLKMTGGDRVIATQVFLAHGNTIPDMPSISQVKKDIGFKGGPISDLQKNLINKRVKEYNEKHNTTHRTIPKVASPTSWELTFRYNLMPKYPNYKVNDVTTQAVIEFPAEDTVVEITKAPSDVIKVVDKAGRPPIAVEIEDERTDTRVYKKGTREYHTSEGVYDSFDAAYNSLFYQLKQTKKGAEPLSSLDTFLLNYLGKFGITVEFIDNFQEKFGVDGIGVADMLTKMVSIAQGKADILTLPEEASHFIIEMMGENNPLFKAMMKDIEKTIEYQEVKKAYKGVYTKEIEFQKEAAGKILSKYIVKQYTGNKESLLQRIVNWFKNAFKSLDLRAIEQQRDSLYKTVADGVLKDSLELSVANIQSTEQMFALNNLDKLKRTLSQSIKAIEEKAKIAQRKLAVGESSAEIEEILRDVATLKQRLTEGNVEMVITDLLKVIGEFEVPKLYNNIESFVAEGKESISSEEVWNTLKAIEFYGSIMNDVLKDLAGSTEFNEWLKNILPTWNSVTIQIKHLEGLTRNVYEGKIKEILNEISISYVDPTGKEIRFDPDVLLESKVGNMGWVAANVMPLHSVNDEVLKMVWKIVTDIHNTSHSKALKNGQKLAQLQKEMEAAGFKDMSIFHERDAQGNKTGFLISSDNWGAYNKAIQDTKTAIMKALGVKEYSDIVYSSLSKADQAVYRKHWSKFSDDYKQKYAEKVTRDGITKTEYKSFPKPPGNPKFQELMDKHPSIRNYYNALLEIHLDTRKSLPKIYNEPHKEMMLPQIRMDDMQLLKSDSLGKGLKKFGTQIKEKFIVQSDDTEYGDQSGMGVSNVKDRLLPIYFTKPLEDMSRLSNDITSMYAHFSEMAYNYFGLSRRIHDLMLIQKAVGERKVYKNEKDAALGISGKRTIGTASREFEALQKFMDIHVYGEQKKKVTIKLGKKEIDITKMAYGILDYIRANNLFMQVFTILSGGLKSNADLFIDARTGLYITDESYRWATGELGKNLPVILKQSFGKFKNNKAWLVMTENGAGDDLNAIFKRLDLNNPINRVTLNDVIYGAYEPFSVQVKGTYALAVYDNFRLVNGKFINKAEFALLPENKGKSASEVTKAWAEYSDKTLYEAMDIKDGVLVPSEEYAKYIDEKLLLKVKSIITARSAVMEGTLNKFDKAAWSSNLAGSLVMMHRSWIVSGIVERFKKGGVSYISGMYEEGFYLSGTKALNKMFGGYFVQLWNNVLKKELEYSIVSYKNLNQHERAGVKRILTDVSITVLAGVMFAILNAAAEDDDDSYWAQFMAYLGTRFFLEQGAFTNITEILNILNTPSAATNFIESADTLIRSLFDDEEIKYGVYEGMSKSERAMIKMSLLKNLYEMQDPQAKNKYVKNQIISGGNIIDFFDFGDN